MDNPITVIPGPPEEVTTDGATYNLQITAFISGSRYVSDVEDDLAALVGTLSTVSIQVQSVELSPQ